MEIQLCERTDLLKKPDLVSIYRFPQIQSYHRKIKFWTKSGESEEEGWLSCQTGMTHSRTVLVATCPVSRRVRKHRFECLSLAPQRNALTIDKLPLLKCLEMFWFPSDMEMEHFCHVKIFHRSDSSLLA